MSDIRGAATWSSLISIPSRVVDTTVARTKPTSGTALVIGESVNRDGPASYDQILRTLSSVNTHECSMNNKIHDRTHTKMILDGIIVTKLV